MENDTKTIMCPICKGGDIKFFLKKNNFDLWRCRSCSHLFIYPFSFNTEVIYGDDYFAGGEKGSGYVNYDADKEPMRPVFEEYMRRIEKLLPQKGELLDIGAATGFFMDIAKARGWGVKGVEISDYAAGLGRAKGLDVRTGVLETVRFDDQSLEVVTMWDVLEHFPNPEFDVKESARILKPGGILAINTPDSGSWYARLLGKKWHLLVPPEHINYFSRSSVKILLERNGFEVVELTCIGKTFTFEYVLHIIGAWLKSNLILKFANKLKSYPWVANISLPINLRDNMFVLARKR